MPAKKTKKQERLDKYNALGSSDGLSEVSRRPFANEEYEIESSSSRASARPLQGNIFDSKVKLKKKQQDLIENNKQDRDTLNLYSSVKKTNEENDKKKGEYEEVGSEDNKTDAANV